MATPKKAPASAAAAKKTPSESSAATAALRKEVDSLSRKLEASEQGNAGIKEAIRRLASGTVVTEEHRDELLQLLGD